MDVIEAIHKRRSIRAYRPALIRTLWRCRRDLGVAFARRFIEDAKSEGLVKVAIERVGMRGAVVAPLE